MSTHAQQIAVVLLVLASPWMAAIQSPAAGREQQASSEERRSAAATVARIQRADYEGDRALLRQLYAELKPVEGGEPSARLHYWRGFALWRRALNGFNDKVEPRELEADLEAAMAEFRAAIKLDPSFVDAKAAGISCLQALAALNRENSERMTQFVSEFQQLFTESLAAQPENPRLLWVVGAQQWFIARQRGDTEETALATYQKGLQFARKQKAAADPLEPSWGEPELLMTLAWGNLNRRKPDLQAAKKYATEALDLVPYWRYLRDILMPQIREAIAKTLSGAGRFAGAMEEGAQGK